MTVRGGAGGTTASGGLNATTRLAINAVPELFDAIGSLAVDARFPPVIWQGNAEFDGASDFSALGALALQAAPEVFDGSSSLSSISSLALTAASTFTGSSTSVFNASVVLAQRGVPLTFGMPMLGW